MRQGCAAPRLMWMRLNMRDTVTDAADTSGAFEVLLPDEDPE
jgi:hypothetical protein